MGIRETRNELLAQRVIEGLKNRNMEGYFAKTKEEGLQIALSLLNEGETVSWGGSYTVAKIGLRTAVKEGNYIAIDRDEFSTEVERKEKTKAGFFADTFLTSTNAITEDGILVNIDGNANRVAAIAFGPEKVIVIAGMNKVVKSEQDAVARARSEAAPMNAQRFSIDTPCKKLGVCKNCLSDDTICCQFLTTRYSRHKGRIKVILIDEYLGF